MEINYTIELLFSLPDLFLSNQAILWSVLNWWKEQKQEVCLGFVNTTDIWGPDWMIYLNSFLYACLIGREEKWLINAVEWLRTQGPQLSTCQLKKAQPSAVSWHNGSGWQEYSSTVNVIIVYEKLHICWICSDLCSGILFQTNWE